MSKIELPLHCLIFIEDWDQLGDLPVPPHEMLSLAIVSRGIVGPHRQDDLAPVMFSELKHRLGLKLSLGERVFLATVDLTIEQCRQLAAFGQHHGCALYQLGSHIAGLGQVVTRELRLVQPTSLQAWQGITVIGDIHGRLAPLEAALAWAKSRQHFVWLLGDILDHGPESLATVDRVYHAVMRGEAAIILANHERKIARLLDRDGHPEMRISDANRVTLDALAALDGRERARWIGRFRALLSYTALLQRFGDVTLLHAAAHPSLWTSRPDDQAVEQYALYGEADRSNGYYRRTHSWIDAIPAGQTVVVGHDALSEYPIIATGKLGGRAVFLDTGCGKGGHLSSADFRFYQRDGHSEFRLECFNRHEIYQTK